MFSGVGGGWLASALDVESFSFNKENWICAMTGHHAEPNNILLIKNLPFDSDFTLWRHPLMIALHFRRDLFLFSFLNRSFTFMVRLLFHSVFTFFKFENKGIQTFAPRKIAFRLGLGFTLGLRLVLCFGAIFHGARCRRTANKAGWLQT